MKFIKISAFAIVLLLLMQIVSKAFIAIDSSDIENIYGFYAEPENSLDMVMIGPSEVYTGYAPALAWEEYGLKSCNLSIGAVPCNMYKSIVTEIVKRQKPKLLVISAAAFSQGNWNLTDEVYLRKWIDNMPMSQNKLDTEHVLLLQPPHETQAADKSGLEQIESITKEYGYDFLDLSTDYESIAGIDDSHDFADFEHLNAYGAKKLTAYIGDMAVNQYGIKSDTAKSELSRWKKSVKRTKKALKMAREYTDRGEAQVVGEYEAAK